MDRRDVLKTGAAALVLSGVAGADEGTGPFALPTTKFKPNEQYVLPTWAFRHDLPVPLAARPTQIGTYEELAPGGPKHKSAFGPGDPVPVGGVFHGVAREWGETPAHWKPYGCDPALTGAAAWNDKKAHFGTMVSYQTGAPAIANWGGFPIKCFKIPIREAVVKLRPDAAFPARVYTYAGTVPGPMFRMRLGQPVVVRFENHLETETSIHLHGGHSPSHSDGFPTFYVLQGKARDYFYPNILPLRKVNGTYEPDVGEAQSTMWYHDHAMDATAYNVSKGLAGVAPCLGENELRLIRERVLPGYGPHSCEDPERDGFKVYPAGHPNAGRRVPDSEMEDPAHPGCYRRKLGVEPYFNPFDIPLVLQDRVIDLKTGQIAYDNTGHNGYLGDTHLVNGAAWPKMCVRNRKYRFRVLDGSNARVFRLRVLRADDFYRANGDGLAAAIGDAIDAKRAVAADRDKGYEAIAQPFLRIGKDSWMWEKAVKLTSVVLAMANRADLVIDFNELAKGLKPGEEREFVLVNTMPQTSGRGPGAKLDDGGDPRVLPLPFDAVRPLEGGGTAPVKLAEADKPIGLLKFVVRYAPPGTEKDDPTGDAEASVTAGTDLLTATSGPLPSYKHLPIAPEEVKAVRHFVFERGKGAWQITGRFYDPTIANAAPILDEAEEWVLENGGGGWWHPIHIHLESHQLVKYEKNFDADEVVDRGEPPGRRPLGTPTDVTAQLPPGAGPAGLHDTMVLGPNTRVRIRMRHRTWYGPFVFHCHNLEHEDMRMMYNFEPVPAPHDPNVAPDARTHGNSVTLGTAVGELPWEYPPAPEAPAPDAGENVIPPRPKK